MHVQSEQMRDLAAALERQLEMQAQAAKLAIREYKRTILREPGSGGAGRSRGQREVQDAITRYVSLLKSLDELRRQMSTGSTEEQPACV